MAKRTDNTIAIRRKEQTMQWPKEGKNRQCNGQKKERTDNAMAKRRTDNTIAIRRKEQTIQWPKEGKNKQCNGQKKKRKEEKQRSTKHYI
jgi:predicted lipoprotein with Yx(FWY)xxD motif